MDGARGKPTGEARSLGDEKGFTLPEVLIVITIMGILFGIASGTWFGVVEGRRVDSATNQLAADLRLAHSSATNRLEGWEVRLTSGSSAYQVGKSGALSGRDFCDDDGCDAQDPKVTFSGGGTVAVTFNSDGSASVPTGSPTVFKVSVDTDPEHSLEINLATSRVKVDP